MCYHKHSGFYGETSASKTDKPPHTIATLTPLPMAVDVAEDDYVDIV